MTWLTKLQHGWATKKHKFPLSATWDSEAITQTQQDGVVRLRWSEIEEVVAYKKDCFAVDQIRLLIVGKDGAIECAEGHQDMLLLEYAVSEHLPRSLPGWHLLLVAAPAFEPNVTYVYQRTGKVRNGEL